MYDLPYNLPFLSLNFWLAYMYLVHEFCLKIWAMMIINISSKYNIPIFRTIVLTALTQCVRMQHDKELIQKKKDEEKVRFVYFLFLIL